MFFWTATINNWQNLLFQNQYKDIIINSLQYLSNNNKIDVFAFVIMPNHIHLIWQTKEMNGKETPQGSFLKYTAHEFKKLLIANNDNSLKNYAVTATNKNFEFWQRDSLAIHLKSKEVAYQKLDYIHANPLSGKWQLVKDMCDYKYSSAQYYEQGVKTFPFLKDLRKEF
ncbi:MAG: transposase [Chitinophagaceae bacterium]|nr:transposase [Chitinophagaceae bacterium]